MPSMANITVKNAASTDVVYVSATPSAGDRSPAVWTANALSPIAGLRPKLDVVARSNGNQTARIVEGRMLFPLTAVVNGQTVRTANVRLEFNCTLPTNVNVSEVTDAFVQFGNLVASTLLREVANTGYAPT